MLKRFTEDLAPPTLEQGELILHEGSAAISKGMFGAAAMGTLILTNARLVWTAKKRSLLPFFRSTVDVPLSTISSVDKGNTFNFVFGGLCIRIRLATGRVETLYVGGDALDDWIHGISLAVSQAKTA